MIQRIQTMRLLALSNISHLMKLTKKKTKKNESNSHNTYIKVLNVNTLLLTLISSPAFNVATYVAVFTTPFEWSNSNVSRLSC